MAAINQGTLTPSATPKIGFKLGLQSAMDTMLANNGTAQASGVHGTFYLTSDTHRLYIGNSDKSISAVNEGVITVSTIDDLPSLDTDAKKKAHAGQFYYIQSGTAANVLCVCSGGRWVQINSVTKVESFGNTVSTASNTATITHSISQTGDGTPLTSIVTFTGASGNTITSNGSNITITGNTASIAAAASDGDTKAQVTVTNSNSTATSNIKFAKGSNINLGVANNEITISATNTTVNSVTGEANAGVNNNGTGFNVIVGSSDGATKTGTIDPIIKYGETGNHSVKFNYNDADPNTNDHGVATLDVYTTTEVDTKINNALKAFDAMTYKGTTTGGNSLPTTSVSNGDTYILETAYNNGTKTYPAGSMVIAQGTEDPSTGYITGTINWQYVDASGSDTTYTATAITHGMEWTASTGGILSTLALAAGTAITITDSASTGNSQTLTITHSNVTRTDPTHDTWVNNSVGSKTINVVTGVTTNAQGHVTGVQVTELSINLSHSTFSSPVSKSNTAAEAFVTTTNSTNGDVTSTVVESTHELTIPGGSLSQSTSAFSIASETLKVIGNNQQVGINLLWGQF